MSIFSSLHAGDLVHTLSGKYGQHVGEGIRLEKKSKYFHLSKSDRSK